MYSVRVRLFLAPFVPCYRVFPMRRASNLYARFGHSESFKSQPRDLAYPSPNFYRGSKSAKFGLILNVAQL